MNPVEMNRDARTKSDSIASFREYMSLERRRASGLSPDELRRWVDLRKTLDRVFGHLDPPDGVQPRSTPRIPTSLEVRFENFGQLESALMSNMSRGGVFIAIEDPPAIGTGLKLRIKVVDPPREIVILGEVASWHVGPRFEVRKRGMGIRFKDLSPADQAFVDDLYEKQAERHLRGD